MTEPESQVGKAATHEAAKHEAATHEAAKHEAAKHEAAKHKIASGALVDVAGVVLAAGAGTRLLPLTAELPKALCPVGNVALVDRAVARVAAGLGIPPGSPPNQRGQGVGEHLSDTVAVNVHHHADLLVSHLSGRVFCSVEQPEALGTAGALAHLRGWLDGRSVLAVNADTWCDIDLAEVVAVWDGERPLVAFVDGVSGAPSSPARVGRCGVGGFGPGVGLVASITPWSVVRELDAVPSGLFGHVWRPRMGGGLQEVPVRGAFVDCGRPSDYLEANLRSVGIDPQWRTGSGPPSLQGGPPSFPGVVASLVDATAAVHGSVTASVIGAGSVIDGEVVGSVIWPGGRVASGERLVGVIRTPGGLTVSGSAGPTAG